MLMGKQYSGNGRVDLILQFSSEFLNCFQTKGRRVQIQVGCYELEAPAPHWGIIRSLLSFNIFLAKHKVVHSSIMLVLSLLMVFYLLGAAEDGAIALLADVHIGLPADLHIHQMNIECVRSSDMLDQCSWRWKTITLPAGVMMITTAGTLQKIECVMKKEERSDHQYKEM